MNDDLNLGSDLSLNIGEPDDEKKKGTGIKGLFRNKLFLVGLILILVIAVAAASFFLLRSPEPTEEPREEEKPVVRHVRESQFSFPDIVSLGSFESPLGDMGGVRTFKITVEIVVDSPSVAQEIQRRSFQIRSTVEALMAIKTFNELQSADGKIILKNELVAGLNRLFETGKVRNIFFSEFIII